MVFFWWNRNTDLCECGCVLSNEPCPCWHSCSSCTYIFHHMSFLGRPSVHLTHPQLTGSPPQTGGPDHFAHTLEPLETHKNPIQWMWYSSNKQLCCELSCFPPSWNGSADSFSPHTEPEIMLTCWVCWLRYSWNSFTKSTGSVLISSMFIFICWIYQEMTMSRAGL